MAILVTGSSGLIGSAAVEFFCQKGIKVVGIDNNGRRDYFGAKGDTTWNLNRLKLKYDNFTHINLDIRDFSGLIKIFRTFEFESIIHCAAQPSHDKAAEFPLVDFSVNASGTLNLLEAFRLESNSATFIQVSTNKVYGDSPNKLKLVESELRYDFSDSRYSNGISENFSIDNSMHSLFGVSKLAGDLLAQEYGKYFDLNVGVFRGGCLTGKSHSGVEQHGFLSYLVKCVISDSEYIIHGYKGKQVRDQIHSEDVLQAFDLFLKNPKKGEVYNLGGGKNNSASILESIKLCESVSNKKLNYKVSNSNRIGDHICYYTDMSKFISHFPDFKIKYDLNKIVTEMVEFETSKSK